MIRREILKEVLLDNRNEVVKHQVIPRSFQFEEFGNYVFVGIRRAGKSFLLYQRIQELLHDGHTWNEMLYVNFEDERLIGMTAADLNLILEVHAEMSTDRPMLFLAEIQNIDGWDKFVRRLADNKYRAYVTGSNAKMLSQDVATTLGGRYITVHVYPYDFKEFLYANGVEVTENSLFATESRAEIKRILFSFRWFSGRGIACRKTGLSDKCLPKDIFRRYCCKTFHRKYFCFTHPFSQIGRKYKATGFVYSYN